jgi:multimeric flavodoxin WrbA
MLIAGVNGSPHSNRNTGTLINKVLEGCRSEGAETTVFELGSMNISPCRACMACKDNKPCARPDDMAVFYKKAPETDGLVIGSPVYLDHISAQLKIFIDRLYCYIGTGMENYYPGGKKAVICITYGAGDEDMYNYILEWIEERLKFYFDIETIGMLKKSSCPEQAVVHKDASLMDQAFSLGQKLTKAALK